MEHASRALSKTKQGVLCSSACRGRNALRWLTPCHPSGTSCDPCRLRKGKCDRYSRMLSRARALGLSSAETLPASEQQTVACSLCLARGLRCTVSQPRRKFRTGRLVSVIERSQLEEGARGQPTCAVAASSTASIPASLETLHGSSAENLLGVATLTPSLLNACVQAYMLDVQPCRGILHPAYFSQNYSAFLDPSEPPTGVPCHPVLLLAIACIGAGQLGPPIAPKGHLAKFELRQHLAARYQEWFEETDWSEWYKKTDACDIVEAAFIMTELRFGSVQDANDTLTEDQEPPSYTPRGGGPVWRAGAHRTVNGLPSCPPPLDSNGSKALVRLDPCSYEFLIHAALRLGIHRRPRLRANCEQGDPLTHVDINGTPITSRESFRRVRVFWSIFFTDTFTSFARRLSPRIGDDDYDLDLPRWQKPSEARSISDTNQQGQGPLGDYTLYSRPSASTVSDPEPANQLLQPQRLMQFDSLHLEYVLRLVFIVRAMSLNFVSARSMNHGVRSEDVARAMAALHTWQEQLPRELRWELHCTSLLTASASTSSFSNSHTARRNAIKSLVLELIFHSQVLGIWSSVSDFGLRHSQPEATEAINLLMERLGLGMQGREEGQNTPGSHSSHGSDCAGKGRPRHERTQDVAGVSAGEHGDLLLQLELRTLESLYRVCAVSEDAAKLGLLRCSRSMFMCVLAAYGHFGLQYLRNKIDNPPPMREQHELAKLCRAVEQLSDAIINVDSWPDASASASHLRKAATTARRHLLGQLEPLLRTEQAGDKMAGGDILLPHLSFPSSTVFDGQSNTAAAVAGQTPSHGHLQTVDEDAAPASIDDVEMLSFMSGEPFEGQPSDWLATFLAEEILIYPAEGPSTTSASPGVVAGADQQGITPA